MDNVSQLRPERKSAWKFIAVRPSEVGTFDVVAWSTWPRLPEAISMFLGHRSTLDEAASFALAKAAQLGINEIVDWSDALSAPDGGDAA